MNNAPSHRQQTSVTISDQTHKQLEELSLRTGLSRSRLYDLALSKFLIWSQLVDDITIRRLSADVGPSLGYARAETGFRRASSAPPKEDPYTVAPTNGAAPRAKKTIPPKK